MSDPTTIEASIKDAIAKHLPTQVGTALQARLAQADADASRVRTLEQELAVVKKSDAARADELGTLRRDIAALQAAAKAVADREVAVLKREQAIDLREAKADLRAEYSAKLVEANERVVLAVFANNRLKYTEQGNIYPPVVVPPPQTVNTPYGTQERQAQVQSSYGERSTTVEG